MTRPQPRYKPGNKIGGRYEVHKALMGGMGEVYLCLDLQENYPYALKTFQQRYQSGVLRQAFEREVATWVALEKHPNIVRCFYMDNLDNQPFMVLEWIAGEEGKGADLRGWLRHGPLDLKTALEVTIDVVRGLIHAQEKQPGLVHRDLKPENILVAQGGLAKITDFGLAQIVEQARLEVGGDTDGRQSMVGKGGIAGTPAYMAPEQWRGEPLNERTDIYAVGCILYEMLAGQWPFRVDFMPITPQQFQQWLSIMQSGHGSASPPALPADLPGAVGELIQGCLAKKPEERPVSLAALIAQLRGLYERQFDQPSPPHPPTTAFSAADYNNRGVTYGNLGQYELALADYTHAIEIDPGYDLAYSNRATAYHALQRYEAALADYGQAIALDPNLARAYSNRGNTYHALQRYEAALVDYGRAIALDPNLARAYSSRGNTYHTLQRYEAALADYRRAIELEPAVAQDYFNRGLTYQDLQQYELALTDYGEAIKLDPTFAPTYYNRGLIYHDLQQYELALADYSQAIDRDPTDAQAYASQGNAYAALQQYELALASFNQAIDLDPSYAKAYYNRGNMYHDLQQYDLALANYSQAIDLDPSFAKAYVNRGNKYKALQQYDLAIADYSQAIDLDPTYARAYYNRGTTFRDLQQYELALADFTRALNLDPSFASACFNIGALFANQGKLPEALSYFEKATQLGHPRGAQYATQVRQELGQDYAPQPDLY